MYKTEKTVGNQSKFIKLNNMRNFNHTQVLKIAFNILYITCGIALFGFMIYAAIQGPQF